MVNIMFMQLDHSRGGKARGRKDGSETNAGVDDSVHRDDGREVEVAKGGGGQDGPFGDLKFLGILKMFLNVFL